MSKLMSVSIFLPDNNLPEYPDFDAESRLRKGHRAKQKVRLRTCTQKCVVNTYFKYLKSCMHNNYS